MKELKEIEKIEKLEKEIEGSIKSLEHVGSFNGALFLGLALGLITNLGATIAYELQIKYLNQNIQLAITISMFILVPLFLAFWFSSHNKVKASRERLKMHLESVREHKRSIKNARLR